MAGPRRDLLAGLTVAIVALPLAPAVRYLVRARRRRGPHHGSGGWHSGYGVRRADLQVSGPTGAMAVVLVPIIHAYGAGGMLTVGLPAGLMLIGQAVARACRYMAFVPASVVEEFTLGIARRHRPATVAARSRRRAARN
ncbi:hypothetical protein [Kribbella yunnanensis]